MTKKKKLPDPVITINKVKMINHDNNLEPSQQMTGLELSYTEEVLDEDGEFMFAKDHTSVKLRNFLCHEDLVKRFESLRAHMALICEFHTLQDEEDFDQVDCKKVFVTQVTLTGHDEDSGVVLTGYRHLKDGSKLNLNTPNIKFETSDYRFSTELSDATDELIEESMKALVKRHRKILQLDLFEEEEEDTSEDWMQPAGAPATG